VYDPIKEKEIGGICRRNVDMRKAYKFSIGEMKEKRYLEELTN
jgi:hypothetical protein